FDLVEHLETLDIGETDREVIFPDNVYLTPAGGEAQVTFRVVGPGALPSPGITTQPTGDRIHLNTPEADIGSLTVVADAVPEGITRGYQWYVQDGANWNAISTATTASLPLAAQINNATEEGTWNFRVVVTNARGEDSLSITSDVAMVTVFDPDVELTWQDVIDSPYIRNRGGNMTASDDGILITTRGTGEHDHNNGLIVDVAALRGLYGGTPDIVITGTIEGATEGNMQMQGMGTQTTVGANGAFTLTLPGGTEINAPGWGGTDGLPWVGSSPDMHGNILITSIVIGTRTIQDLLRD
ncbi:MAG: hypothetical protein FWD88_07920, partial [Treponema sp.]|nr:hypothetical protein [Treponema sp.]